MSAFKSIRACRACDSPDLEVLLDLGEQVLTGRFPRSTEEDIPKAPLCVVRCRNLAEGCGLVQLRESFDPGALYGETYGYRSGLNQSMVKHLQGKAERIRRTLGGISGIVLDIGSNDCTLLKALDGPATELIGIDPSAAKFSQFYPSHVRYVADFFSAEKFHHESGGRNATLVTSIAMFYDLEAPVDFAREVASILGDEGVWVFEQSYLPAMLARKSFDTICHEHSEYYALRQILYILKKAGLKAIDIEFNDANGGSFSVTAARSSSGRHECLAQIKNIIDQEDSQGITDGTAWTKFKDSIDTTRDSLLQFLNGQRSSGRLTLGYGASTKGNVLLQYCDITPALLPAVAEVNPDKFGAFTPGTLIPIIPEAEARQRNPDAFLVLPWHFRENIIEREQAFLASGGRLVFPLPELSIVENSMEEFSRTPVDASSTR